MTRTMDQVTRELHSINTELEALYKNFESTQEIQLEPLQHRFAALIQEVQGKGLKSTPECEKAIAAARHTLDKLTTAMAQYKTILESQLQEVGDQKVAFKAYINSMHME